MSNKTILVELPATFAETSKTIKHALEYDPASKPFLPNLSEYEMQILQDCASGALFEKIARAVNYLDIDVESDANLLLAIKALAAKIDKMSAADLRKSGHSIDTLQLVASYTHFKSAAAFMYWYKSGNREKFIYDLANLQSCELILQSSTSEVAVGEDNIFAFITYGLLHVIDLNTRKIIYACETGTAYILSVKQKSVITYNHALGITAQHFFYENKVRQLFITGTTCHKEHDNYVMARSHMDEDKLIIHDDNILEINRQYTHLATNNKFFCFWFNLYQGGYSIILFNDKADRIWSKTSDKNTIKAAQFHSDNLYYLSCEGILFSFNTNTLIEEQRIIIGYVDIGFSHYYITPHSNVICCGPNNIIDLETGLRQEVDIEFIIGSYIINKSDIVHIPSLKKVKRPSNILLQSGATVDEKDRVVAYDIDSRNLVLFSLREAIVVCKISNKIVSSDYKIFISGNNRFAILLEDYDKLSLLS